jgi:hypothetical protein
VWTFILVAVSASGKWSDPSDPVTAEVVDTMAPSDLQDLLVGFDSSITAVQTSVNGKNTITNSTVNADPSVPGVSAGDRWQKWTTLAIGGKLLATWRWDGAQWIPEAMDPSYLPLVDIGQGTFGSLDGGRLSANSVAVQKLLVGSFDNVIPDPTFSNVAGDWGVAAAPYSFPATEGYNGTPALKIAPNALQAGRYCAPVPVVGAASYRLTVWVKSDVAIPAGALGLYTKSAKAGGALVITNQLKQTTGAAGNDAIPANTWTQLSAVMTFDPASVAGYFGFYKQTTFTTGTVWYSNASATRMGDGKLVVDGILDGKLIRGVTVIGSEVKTSDVTGEITARMGPQSVWDPFGGQTRAGIGFSKIGTNDATPAGMYSTDGYNLYIQQANAGGSGGCYMSFGVTNQDIYYFSYGVQEIAARGGLTLGSNTGAVSINGAAGIKLNSVPQPKDAHWTMTSTQSSVPTGTYYGPGTPAYDSANTSDPGLVTWSAADTIKFRDAGIYAVSVGVRFTGAMGTSGTSPMVSIEIPGATSSQIAYAKGPILAGDTQGTASIPNIKVAAGTTMKFVTFQNTGSSQTAYWRINVTRIG